MSLITELEILHAKNSIYKALLNDLEIHNKNESLINSVKKIIKNNHKIIINIEDTIENEFDFSEGDDLIEKIYNQPNDFSKLIKKKYLRYDLSKLVSRLSRNETKFNDLLNDSYSNLQELFDTKLKIQAIKYLIDNKN
jgi:hypothetical protein